MNAPDRLPDLSPARVEALPKWAAVAFATRCALRVLPAFLPSAATNRMTRRAADLRAAHAYCLIAWHTAFTEGGRFRDLGAQANAVLRTEFSGVGGSARSCVVAAAQSAAERDLDRSFEIISTVLGHYRAAAESAADEFEKAAAADVRELERFDLGDVGVVGKAVPEAFFSRPLFEPEAGIPVRWKSIVDEWATALESFGERSIHDFYVRVCNGAVVTQAELVEIINAWRQRHGNEPPAASEQAVAPPLEEAQSGPEVAFVGAAPAVVQAAQPVTISFPPPATPPSQVSKPSEAPPGPTDRWMVSDRPLEAELKKRDRFGFYDYAEVLAAVLDHDKTDTPFTMAINAPWGAGKTTLANMIVEWLHQLRKDSGKPKHIICWFNAWMHDDAPNIATAHGKPKHIICWFNAWMHDDAPNIATALISQVCRTANEHRRQFVRWFNPLPSAVLEPGKRKGRRLAIGVVVLVLPLLASWWAAEHLQHVRARDKYDTDRVSPYQMTQTVTQDATGRDVSKSVSEMSTQSREVVPAPQAPAGDRWDQFVGAFEQRIVVLSAFFTALVGVAGVLVKVLAFTPVSGFVESPEKAAEAGAIPSTEQQLKTLIEQATWRGNRFVLFIDDLERCTPPRSIDVLKAVSQLLDHHGVVVVLLGDMAAVAAAAQLKYKDLAKIHVPSAGIEQAGPDRGKEAYGRMFLQKIVQFQFDLPIPAKGKILRYMRELAVTPQEEGKNSGRTAT